MNPNGPSIEQLDDWANHPSTNSTNQRKVEIMDNSAKSAADCSASELSAMLEIAVQLREILWCDANSMVQGGMIGCPVECFAFAKWWIMRAKGIPTDVPGGYPIFSENIQNHPPKVG